MLSGVWRRSIGLPEIVWKVSRGAFMGLKTTTARRTIRATGC
jgi:hypothetical protein